MGNSLSYIIMIDYIICAMGIVAIHYAFKIKTEKYDRRLDNVVLFILSVVLKISFITFGLICINYSGIIPEILN